MEDKAHSSIIHMRPLVLFAVGSFTVSLWSIINLTWLLIRLTLLCLIIYIFDEALINRKRNDNCGKDAAITKTEIKLQLL